MKNDYCSHPQKHFVENHCTYTVHGYPWPWSEKSPFACDKLLASNLNSKANVVYDDSEMSKIPPSEVVDF